jgi:hypothetical protein
MSDECRKRRYTRFLLTRRHVNLTYHVRPADVRNALIPEQRRYLGPYFIQYLSRAASEAFSLAHFPVDAFQMISQDDTGRPTAIRNDHFEWVSFGLIRDGHANANPDLTLYIFGLSTSAGRRLACSRPAWGVEC